MDQLLLRPEEVAKCLNDGRSKVYELNARRHARVGPHRNLPPSHPGRSRAVRRLTTIRDGHLVSTPCHRALCSSPAARRCGARWFCFHACLPGASAPGHARAGHSRRRIPSHRLAPTVLPGRVLADGREQDHRRPRPDPSSMPSSPGRSRQIRAAEHLHGADRVGRRG